MTLTVEQALQFAIAQQCAGQTAAAESMLRQIIAMQPRHAEANYRLGVIALCAGRVREAADLIAAAVAEAPSEAQYHGDLGVALWSLRRGEESLAALRRAIALRPDYTEAHYNLAYALDGLGRVEEAIASYRRAIELRPAYIEAHNNLGNLFAKRGEVAEAAACFERALAISPGFLAAQCNLGDVRTKMGRAEEAVELLRRVIAQAPDLPEAHNNLGGALWRLKRRNEAMTHYRRAVELRPEYPEALNNLGGALLESDRIDEAIALFERAAALNPALADVHGNLGVALMRQGHYDRAIACCRRAVACNPHYADGHWNLSLLLLLTGHFEEGWREHEWRWRTEIPVSPLRNFTAPQWEGEPMPGGTLLLHAEQGFGDTMQFVRYVPLARERSQAARVILECPRALQRILTQTKMHGVEVIARTSWSAVGLPPFDRHLPLLSLPLALGLPGPLRMAAPYLHAQPELRASWLARLPEGFRVGLAWAGRREHANDRHRSIPFEKLGALLRVEGVSFHSLQLDPLPTRQEALADHSAELADFGDTAALVAELDLVIAVDTAAAHLAGAMGRPVWLLLPCVPDWRWGVAGEETPWYPSMRIFRQCAPGDWDDLLARCSVELSRLRTAGLARLT